MRVDARRRVTHMTRVTHMSDVTHMPRRFETHMTRTTCDTYGRYACTCDMTHTNQTWRIQIRHDKCDMTTCDTYDWYRIHPTWLVTYITHTIHPSTWASLRSFASPATVLSDGQWVIVLPRHLSTYSFYLVTLSSDCLLWLSLCAFWSLSFVIVFMHFLVHKRLSDMTCDARVMWHVMLCVCVTESSMYTINCD